MDMPKEGISSMFLLLITLIKTEYCARLVFVYYLIVYRLDLLGRFSEDSLSFNLASKITVLDVYFSS